MSKPPETRIPGPLGRRHGLRAPWMRRVAPLGRVVADTAFRAFDLVFALIALLGLLPVFILRGLVAVAREGHVLESEPCIGRFRSPFQRLRFASPFPGGSLAVVLNILRGEMSWVGPRPLSPSEEGGLPVTAFERFQVRPGLVSPFRLRKRTGVAYSSEFELDNEYVYGQTFPGDLGLLARSIPASVLGGGGGEGLSTPYFSIFGVRIANATFDGALNWIFDRVHLRQPSQIAFVNPDCLNIAYVNPEYHAVLEEAGIVLPDGIGIHLACRMLGTPLLANVNGTDLFPKLCERAAALGTSLFLFGARPGVAKAASEEMTRRFPELRIAGARDGFFPKEEENSVIDAINASGADILLVAMGAPRQDLWLAANASSLTPTIRMGVGGLFDFYGGRIPRAPVWMREIGLEWLYRLLQEPGRMWKRYLVGNPLFLFRVYRELNGRDREPR